MITPPYQCVHHTKYMLMCSPLRLNRFHRTPAWAPSLPPRATTLSSASMPAARLEGSKLSTDRAAPTHVPATSALQASHREATAPGTGNASGTGVDWDPREEDSIDSIVYGGDAKGGVGNEDGAVRLGGGTLDGLRKVPTAVDGLGGEEGVKKGTVSALPKEELGATIVSIGANQGGRDCESKGEVVRSDALTTNKKRTEQGAYALVQLSTRCVPQHGLLT